VMSSQAHAIGNGTTTGLLSDDPEHASALTWLGRNRVTRLIVHFALCIIWLLGLRARNPARGRGSLSRLLLFATHRHNTAIMELEEHLIECPYCAEVFTVLVDPATAGDQYVEDCEICCQPIVFWVSDNGAQAPCTVHARRENE